MHRTVKVNGVTHVEVRLRDTKRLLCGTPAQAPLEELSAGINQNLLFAGKRRRPETCSDCAAMLGEQKQE